MIYSRFWESSDLKETLASEGNYISSQLDKHQARLKILRMQYFDQLRATKQSAVMYYSVTVYLLLRNRPYPLGPSAYKKNYVGVSEVVQSKPS